MLFLYIRNGLTRTGALGTLCRFRQAFRICALVATHDNSTQQEVRRGSIRAKVRLTALLHKPRLKGEQVLLITLSGPLN